MTDELNNKTDFTKIIEEAKDSMLPFESWEKLPKETSAAFAAFCVFRDFGGERSLKHSLEIFIADNPSAQNRAPSFQKQYGTWRVWSANYEWFKRAADYDTYLDRIKQAERRKTIEVREAAHQEATGKMLLVSNKKLDLLLQVPEELSQNNIKDWVEYAINTERDLFGLLDKKTESVSGKFDVHFQKTFEGL
jgi:hypothetical protein